MCIIAFHYDKQQQALTIAANRDEFYARPTASLHEWTVNGVNIYGGRDLKEMGTWMAANEHGHFVAITNYRNPALDVPKPLSRGQIATDFLTADTSAMAFAERLQQQKELYGPFNVLLFDGEQLVHYNNIFDTISDVADGIHVLCNATLNTPWPKVERLRQRFSVAFATAPTSDQYLAILQDEQLAADEHLPSTGVDFALEKALSAIFIRLPEYGTRCSTICSITKEAISMEELTYVNGTATTTKHIEKAVTS